MITRNGLNLEFITIVLNEVKTRNRIVSSCDDFYCDKKFLPIFEEYPNIEDEYYRLYNNKKEILTQLRFCFEIVQLIIQNLSEQNDDHPDIPGEDN